MDETPYVIIVHGTWNIPREGELLWYQLNEQDASNFCYQLNDRLEAMGLGRPVWRPCDGRTIDFKWSGKNTHEAREDAATSLSELLIQLTRNDSRARIHIVSHSHGGNVTLRAIDKYKEHLWFEAHKIMSKLRQELPLNSSFDLALEKTFEDVRTKPNALVRFLKMAAQGLDFGPISFAGIITEVIPALRWAIKDSKKHSVRPFAQIAPEINRIRGRLHNPNPFTSRVGTDGPAVSHFAELWVNGRETNRLGRLVFLGTPFYIKQWSRRFVAYGQWFYALLDIPVIIPHTVAGYYLIILICWFILHWIPFIGVSLPPINPLDWPSTLVMVWFLFSLLVAVVGIFLPTNITKKFNLYFPALMKGSLMLHKTEWPEVWPLEALVITAGPLDEVYLLMSSEPIVYSLLKPQIHNLLFPKTDWSFPRNPSGYEGGIFIRIFKTVLKQMHNINKLAFFPVIWLGKKSLETYIVSMTLNVTKAGGYGIEPIEFWNAEITARLRPELPGIVSDRMWNVSRHVAMQPPVSGASALVPQLSQRYSFLSDPQALEAKANNSWMCSQIETMSDELRQYYGNIEGSERDFLVTLKQHSLLFEERIKEFVGLVALVHSHYYANPSVIHGIAEFLGTGRYPEESQP